MIEVLLQGLILGVFTGGILLILKLITHLIKRATIDEQTEPEEFLEDLDIPEEVKQDIVRRVESMRNQPQGEQTFADTALSQTETPRLQPPSPSMLVYLFADRIFQQGGRLTWKMRVPCKDDVTVAAKDLAAGLIAVSFLSLREQGFIRLEPFEKQKLFVGPTPALRVVKAKQIEEDELVGRAPLEWLLLMFLRDREEDDISNLLKGWLVPGAWREAHL